MRRYITEPSSAVHLRGLHPEGANFLSLLALKWALTGINRRDPNKTSICRNGGLPLPQFKEAGSRA